MRVVLVTDSTVQSYLDLLGEGAPDIQVMTELSQSVDFAHIFTTSRTNLADFLPLAMAAIAPNGMIWVSWPKKASKVPSEVTEDIIRELALPLGLVDVKVCAVDEVWSGLKLVIRKERR